jgi:hypothetical protein
VVPALCGITSANPDGSRFRPDGGVSAGLAQPFHPVRFRVIRAPAPEGEDDEGVGAAQSHLQVAPVQAPGSYGGDQHFDPHPALNCQVTPCVLVRVRCTGRQAVAALPRDEDQA